jgi:FolB domain-containing protein
MDVIHLCDLEVFYHVGVPDQERANPQRLLIDVQIFAEFGAAAASDDLTKTIDYFAVTQRLLKFGDGRQWKLIEKLASDIAKTILTDFSAERVRVEVKKFIIPQTRYVSVAVEREK